MQIQAYWKIINEDVDLYKYLHIMSFLWNPQLHNIPTFMIDFEVK